MRLIDADALVQALHKADTVMGQPHFLCRTVYGCINKAPTIDVAPKWIPCEERLPELDEICLVTEKDGSIRHCYFDSVDPVLFATVEEGMYVRNVVAWMPLPKPYVGERKDDE